MAKFSRELYTPGFFDIAQDIGRGLPTDVLEQWLRGDQSVQAARTLLEPYLVRGSAVSTDAAGLSRLTGQRGLHEILALLNRPKEIVYGYGRAIGGQSVGVWAADNTQMLYPGDVPIARVVEMLLATQERIARECEVSFGAALHTGEFLHIADGLYGDDAERVEEIAENHTAGGEVVLTDSALDAVAGSITLDTETRTDAPPELGVFHRVNAGPTATDIEPTDTAYPAPFSEEFTRGISGYRRSRKSLTLRAVMEEHAASESAVALVEREREDTGPSVARVLNDFALSVLQVKVGADVSGAVGGRMIKTVGTVGIYVLPTASAAVEFALRVRETLAGQRVQCRIGVDVGDVLIFDLPGGGRDIAGMPVNVASKMAQDCGTMGHVYVSDRAWKALADPPAGFARDELHASGLTLETWVG